MRKTDLLPVTDSDLEMAREMIAIEYGRPSEETDSLLQSIAAGNMANAIAREAEIHSLRSQLEEAVALLRRVVNPFSDDRAITAIPDARDFLSRIISGGTR